MRPSDTRQEPGPGTQRERWGPWRWRLPSCRGLFPLCCLLSPSGEVCTASSCLTPQGCYQVMPKPCQSDLALVCANLHIASHLCFVSFSSLNRHLWLRGGISLTQGSEQPGILLHPWQNEGLNTPASRAHQALQETELLHSASPGMDQCFKPLAMLPCSQQAALGISQVHRGKNERQPAEMSVPIQV